MEPSSPSRSYYCARRATTAPPVQGPLCHRKGLPTAGAERMRSVADATKQSATFAPRTPQCSNGWQAHPPMGASSGTLKKALSAAIAQAYQHGKLC
eukprot:274531-Pyramimonas_sp.AAC.1